MPLPDNSTSKATLPERTGSKASSSPLAAAGVPVAPRTIYLVILFILASAVFWLVHHGDWQKWWLEDLHVYSYSLLCWLAGNNPYNNSLSPLFFLYPPAFLYLAKFVVFVLPLHWGEETYLAIHVASTVALPLVLARYFFRQAWLGPLFALQLFFASPRFTGVLALWGLNVASTLYCIALIAAVPGLRRNRWEWFYLAVFLAAIIKITFLALLLLPFLVGRRQWKGMLACVGAVLGMNLVEAVGNPSLYHGYQWALKQGILVQQQFGYGVFGMLATYHHRPGTPLGVLPYAGFLLMAATIGVLMLRMRRRLELAGGLESWGSLSANGVWLALVVVTIVLANPREMQYDVDIALIAAFVLWVYGLQTRRLLGLMVVLFLPSLVVPLVVLNPHMHGLYETLLVLTGFGLGYWRLWRDSGSKDQALASAA